MSREFAIADTCFLIDWARYRRRDLLFSLFRTVFVPESVLREVKSGETIAWIASSLARGSLSLYVEAGDEVEEARRLVEESRVLGHLPSVDYPEAFCLVVGRRRGYVVLTENRGALIAADLLPAYRGVAVWRSFEVLWELVQMGLLPRDCGNPLAPLLEYQVDTKHVFPQKDLKAFEAKIRRECGEVDRGRERGQRD